MPRVPNNLYLCRGETKIERGLQQGFAHRVLFLLA